MADPTAGADSLVNPKGSHQLLEAVPLRAIADDGKTRQIIPPEGRRRAQCEIASFAGDEKPDENQFKFGTWFRAARIIVTQAASDAWLRDKKHFVAIDGKLCVGL